MLYTRGAAVQIRKSLPSVWGFGVEETSEREARTLLGRGAEVVVGVVRPVVQHEQRLISG